MRIISGQYGGRVIQTPLSKRIHPMSEKIRGSIFSTLGNVDGLNLLDLYSGSGALAIEAISRSAGHVSLVESDFKATSLIINNLKSLSIERNKVEVIKSRVESWLNANDQKFDLVIADPPYDALPNNLTLDNFASLLKQSSILVLSWPGKINLPDISNLKLIKSKSFKDAQIGYYALT